jgi:hypothetical protein
MAEINEQETSPTAPNVPAPDHSVPVERHPEAGFTASCTKPPDAPEPDPQQNADDGVPATGPVTLKLANGRKVVVVIDEEFRKRLRPQTEQERAVMERNLLRDHFIVVTVWAIRSRRVVLDGHRGLATCLRHGIPVLLREVNLRDRAAARRWIDDNQRGRRNLTREEAAYTVGTLYNQTKLPHGGSRTGRGSSAKNWHLKTADALAKRYHVAASTVRNAADYAAAVDKIAQACGDGPKQLILGGDSGLTQKDVIELVQDVPGKAALRTAVLKYLSERADPEGSLTGADADQSEKASGKKARGRINTKAVKATAPQELARAAGADGDSLSALSWAQASLNMGRELFRRVGKKPKALAFVVFKALGQKKAAAVLLALKELLTARRKCRTDKQEKGSAKPDLFVKPQDKPAPHR